jgi:hypothetical protein
MNIGYDSFLITSFPSKKSLFVFMFERFISMYGFYACLYHKSGKLKKKNCRKRKSRTWVRQVQHACIPLQTSGEAGVIDSLLRLVISGYPRSFFAPESKRYPSTLNLRIDCNLCQAQITPILKLRVGKDVVSVDFVPRSTFATANAKRDTNPTFNKQTNAGKPAFCLRFFLCAALSRST